MIPGHRAIADEELARHCLLIVMASPADVPMAAAVLVYRPRSEPMPTVASLVPDVAMRANVPFACLGVAFAMRVLMERFAVPGLVPEVFDERLFPLCRPNAPVGIISFVWTDLPVPRLHTVHDFVLLVVSRLQLSLKELALAHDIVEKLVNDQPVYAQAHCLRPIFLIACVLAAKVINDQPYFIGSCHRSLSDVFTATSIPLMKVMERQLLVILDFSLPVAPSHGPDAQNCARLPRHHTRARTRTPANPLLPPRRADADAFNVAEHHAKGHPSLAPMAPRVLSSTRPPPTPQHIAQRRQRRQHRRDVAAMAAARLQAVARGMAARRTARTARAAQQAAYRPLIPAPRASVLPMSRPRGPPPAKHASSVMRAPESHPRRRHLPQLSPRHQLGAGVSELGSQVTAAPGGDPRTPFHLQKTLTRRPVRCTSTSRSAHRPATEVDSSRACTARLPSRPSCSK